MLCKKLDINEENLADKKDKLDNLKEELASLEKTNAVLYKNR